MAGTPQCARPGCGAIAAAWLSYDYAGQRVWLDDPGADAAGHHSALCATHAGRLRPPQGWSCQDRRTARPSSQSPVPAPKARPAPPSRPAVEARSPATPQPAPAPDPDVAVSAAAPGDSSAGLTAIAV